METPPWKQTITYKNIYNFLGTLKRFVLKIDNTYPLVYAYHIIIKRVGVQ